MVESALVRGAHDHAGSLAGLKRFLPTRSTLAPTVAGFQAAKAEFRHRCRKIVALPPGLCGSTRRRWSKHIWSKAVGRKLGTKPRRSRLILLASVRLLTA